MNVHERERGGTWANALRATAPRAAGWQVIERLGPFCLASR